jgi:Kdo2-lipid IVA lauroyltransferase/acyltransferase
LRENLARSALCDTRDGKNLLRQAVAHAGKAAAELPLAWLGDTARLPIRTVHGWDEAQAALQQGKGVIFMTLHLGAFEIVGRFLASRTAVTHLYRPPKVSWLEPLMRAGRAQDQAKLVPTDLSGVRALLTALKRGEAIGILPDQAPGAGEGVWADFFGRPAYTMTLVSRLQQKTGAPIILIFAERLPRGRGYSMHLRRLADLPQDQTQAAREMNRVMEEVIRAYPAQYLWSYNRHKVPAGAKPATAMSARPPESGI